MDRVARSHQGQFVVLREQCPGCPVGRVVPISLARLTVGVQAGVGGPAPTVVSASGQ